MRAVLNVSRGPKALRRSVIALVEQGVEGIQDQRLELLCGLYHVYASGDLMRWMGLGSAGDKVAAVLAGGGATVDGNVRAGDIGRPRRRQESDDVGDLLRLGGPTTRCGLTEGIEEFP